MTLTNINKFAQDSISFYKTLNRKATKDVGNKIEKYVNSILPEKNASNEEMLLIQDSVMTDQNGYFSTQIDSGVYDISISKKNYNSNYLNNYLIFSSRVLNTDTLNIIDKPNIVKQVNPFNNSLRNIQPIMVKWNMSERVETYRLQASTDSLFTTLLMNDSTLTDTSKQLPQLSDLTKYYWRIKASNVGGESDWSEVWNFKTLGVPTTVSLLEPQNGFVNQPLNITFKWSKAKDQTLSSIKKNNEKGFSPNEMLSISNYWFELVKDTVSLSGIISDTAIVDTFKVVNNLMLCHICNVV